MLGISMRGDLIQGIDSTGIGGLKEENTRNPAVTEIRVNVKSCIFHRALGVMHKK